MNILNALSVIVLLSVPSVDSEPRDFQYDGPGLALITPFNIGILAVPWDYGSALYLEGGKAARSIPWHWDESTRCSVPSSCGDSAAICINRNALDYIVLFTSDSLLDLYGPFTNAGMAAFDGFGNIWFTADGFLYRNGISTEIELESHTVAVDHSGSRIAFCDSSDRICLLNTSSGESSVLASDYRFYSPLFVSSGGTVVIVTSSLEGEIVKVSPDDGTCTSLAEGSMPFWWKEMGVLLYSVTSDDGHTITSGEIWKVSLEGENQQITFSSGVHEIHPIALDVAVFAIDAITGSLITVPDR
ncbi:MAG: hypothetical protein KAR44_02070 [Candidatus Aegiribacteria sp.]|nr:hypothetical protein [Candidatus Aegiribacteria sp.]